MAKKQPRISPKLQPWIDARRKFGLSHEHVQMARELGMNPKKLGKLDNHDQEPWKLPLPEFIEKIYLKRFGKRRPDAVRSIEEMATEAYPVDSGLSRCSMLSNRIGAVARVGTDGEGAVACGIQEVVFR